MSSQPDPQFLIQYLQNEGKDPQTVQKNARLYDFLKQIYSRLTAAEALIAQQRIEIDFLLGSGLVGTFDIAASVNNFELQTYPICRLVPSANLSVTGFMGSFDGDRRLIVNAGTGRTITLVHQSASSTADNRMECQGSANIVLTTGFSAEIWYDKNLQRWRAYAE